MFETALDIVIVDTVSHQVAVIEAKAPLAPHGARLTARLAGRVEHGLTQLDKFRNLSGEIKKDIILREFEDVIDNPSWSYILLARSCFGSVSAWERNAEFMLLTLPLLSGASVNYKPDENLEAYFKSCIDIFDDFYSQCKSNWEVARIDLCGKEINFPNLIYDDAYVEQRRKELHVARE